MTALALSDQLDQEVTVAAIEARMFECSDIECGAVFLYRRVSLGRFVQPDFCPTCGGSMEFSGEHSSDLRQFQGEQFSHRLG
jgi:hypothetical protein